MNQMHQISHHLTKMTRRDVNFISNKSFIAQKYTMNKDSMWKRVVQQLGKTNHWASFQHEIYLVRFHQWIRCIHVPIIKKWIILVSPISITRCKNGWGWTYFNVIIMLDCFLLWVCMGEAMWAQIWMALFALPTKARIWCLDSLWSTLP